MATRTPAASRALAHQSRVSILHALQQTDRWMGVHELAPGLGLHRTTAREHLELLVEAGYVAKSVEARTTRGRPRIVYRAREWPQTPPAEAWFRDNLIRILLAGYGRALPSRAEAAVAGGEQRALGWSPPVGARPGSVGQFSGEAELHQLATIEAHLEELGFEPEVDPEEPQIHLRRCPFLDLAREHTDVVCSVHLGLARGVLAQQSGPLAAARLEPFVGPEHCILHLRREAPSAPL